MESQGRYRKHKIDGNTHNRSIGAHTHQAATDTSQSEPMPDLSTQITANNSISGTLPHYEFVKGNWKRPNGFQHPKLKVTVYTHEADYKRFNLNRPTVKAKEVEAVTDSGAQSSVWSREEFLEYGFQMNDLIPTTHIPPHSKYTHHRSRPRRR